MFWKIDRDPMKFFKIFIVLFLILLNSGCIDNVVMKKVSDLNPNQENQHTKDKKDIVNKPLPEEVELENEKEVVEKENQSQPVKDETAASGISLISSNIPDVPAYPEEKSSAVYPKEYRLLSLNFQRAIASGNESIAAEVFNITGKTSGYNIKDACDVFDYVNKYWQYRYDKNAEFFFGASQTINEGYNGDCDDYSIVISALLRNMGFNTRIVTGNNGDYGHAYPELYIGSDKETAYEILSYVQNRYSFAENIWYSSRELDEGKTQYWLNFDWSGSNGYRHPGGEYFEGVQAIFYPRGLIEF